MSIKVQWQLLWVRQYYRKVKYFCWVYLSPTLRNTVVTRWTVENCDSLIPVVCRVKYQAQNSLTSEDSMKNARTRLCCRSFDYTECQLRPILCQYLDAVDANNLIPSRLAGLSLPPTSDVTIYTFTRSLNWHRKKYSSKIIVTQVVTQLELKWLVSDWLHKEVIDSMIT